MAAILYPRDAAHAAEIRAAGHEIFRLAKLHNLDHVELARRECQYSGTVAGREICVSVYDCNPIEDLAALRAAIDTASAPLFDNRVA